MIWQPILAGLGGVEASDGLEGHVFLNYGSGNDVGPPPDVWQMVDVLPFGIPRDAACIDISGILIITMGTMPGYENLCLAFRTPGRQANIRTNYAMQCIANTGDGMRSTASYVVGLSDGRFEWGWFQDGVGLGWPQKAAVAANLTITRWMR